ncbi:hypothetical protein pETSU_139 [Edwardsiella phage pEt-SU]|uniref:Uncharacterized protein n=1 Tax=Edwardsiella phage pEt-SU TaxID=2562142 RepID=A0A4D6DWK6_9CAUD|nr:hypothetical protein HOV39_gp139 [Edwardsiella phage pEt-SU]QBZ70720.1 hypothetical protein pETSU_139 [Edwardsiella phage pEt-SU]
MKTILAAILFCFTSVSFAASYDMKTGDELVGDRCAPGDVIYYGVTKKGTKDVVICQDGQTVTYGFGNILKNWSGKDLVLDVKSSEVIERVTDNDQESSEIFIVRNATNAYAIVHRVDLKTGDETNTLEVHTRDGKKQLANIELDNDFIVNRIRDNFVK